MWLFFVFELTRGRVFGWIPWLKFCWKLPKREGRNFRIGHKLLKREETSRSGSGADWLVFVQTYANKLRRCGIVVMDFDCYTGDRSSIPTHSDSLGKWMNLRLGWPMPCEGNWVVSPRCWQDINYIVSIIAKMGFSAPVSYTHLRAHETDSYLVCRLLLEKKKQNK